MVSWKHPVPNPKTNAQRCHLEVVAVFIILTADGGDEDGVKAVVLPILG